MKRLTLLMSLAASLSWGQTSQPRPAQKPAPVPVQKIDFGEGDLIDGTRTMPLGELYLVKDKPGFKSLITVRSNFNDKLLASVNEL